MSKPGSGILLVEDDRVDVMTVQRALKRHAIPIPLYVARTATEALELLRGVAPPAVPMAHIFMAVVPYVIMSLLLLAAVFWIPGIATWLPQLIG